MLMIIMTEVMENTMLNNTCNITINDETSNDKIVLTHENISKYFKDVYLLVKRNNIPIPADFYNWNVDPEIFKTVIGNLLIHKVSVKILKNKNHFDNICLMSKEQLDQFNIYNYELADKNIVVQIFNINYMNLLPYIQQYESTDTLKNLYNILVLNKYFNVDNTQQKTNIMLNSIINNLDESDYWVMKYNCSNKLNLTDEFKNRMYYFQPSRIIDKNVSNVIKDIINKNKLKKTSKGEDYLKDINNNSKQFIDISTVINKNKKLYQIPQPSEFTKEDINMLFNNLDKKQSFLLFANLMVSKKYCHLVVCNKYILTKMKDELKLFAPLFRYLMGYAWVRFYIDECMKKTFIKTTDDICFDIDTAAALPTYPISYVNPKLNPYNVLFVDDNVLNPSNNLCSFHYNNTMGLERINTLEEFKTNFNIFTTGNPNYDLFQNYDCKKNKCAFSGSIMSACVQKNSPLLSTFESFNKKNNYINNYTDFLNEYYANADIDIMFYYEDIFKFIDSVYELYNTVIINMCNYSKYVEPSHIKIKLHKSVYVFVTEKFILDNIKTDEKDIIIFVKENIDDDNIKAMFKPFYDKLIIEKEQKLLSKFTSEEIDKLKKIYPDIFNYDNINLKIYINQEYNDVKPIDVDISYKYSITSTHLLHNLELFPVKYNDFLAVVSKFHLPCVRSFYDGTNVYMTPSCISAHMTFMNLDYKYVAGTKDIMNIINKNRLRGYGTWNSEGEKKYIGEYCSNVSTWSSLLGTDSKKIFGPLSLNNKFYRPRYFNMDEYINATPIDLDNRYDNKLKHKDIIHNNDLINDMIIKNGSLGYINNDLSLYNYNTIGTDGSINPLQRWLIESAYNIYLNKK